MLRFLPTVIAILVAAYGEAHAIPPSPIAGLEAHQPQTIGPWLAALLVPLGAALVARVLTEPALRAVKRGELHRADRLYQRGRLLTLGAVAGLSLWGVSHGDWYVALSHVVPVGIPSGVRILALLPLASALLASWWVSERVARKIYPPSLRGLRGPRSQWRPALLVLAPYLIITGVLDLSWAFPKLRVALFTDGFFATGAVLLLFALIVLTAPFFLRFLWPNQPLPAGPLREHFEAIARSVGTSYRQILVWNTHSRSVVNASVAGMIAPIRYVFFTDGILALFNRDQLGGVFAHELAHAKRHHFVIYFSGVLALLFACSLIEGAALDLSEPNRLAALAVVLVLAWLGFGALSRHLEREADIVAAATVTPEVYDSTLNALVQLEGGDERRSWRHPTLGLRRETLRRYFGEPEYRRRFHRRKALLVSTVFLLLAATAWGYYQELEQDRQRPPFEKHLLTASAYFTEYESLWFRPGPSQDFLGSLLDHALLEEYAALKVVPDDPEWVKRIQIRIRLLELERQRLRPAQKRT